MVETILKNSQLHGECNYIPTNMQVYFDPDQNRLFFGQVCCNEYGSMYGCGNSGSRKISKKQAESLPVGLTQEPNWILI